MYAKKRICRESAGKKVGQKAGKTEWIKTA